jgi:hypothetical protein
VHQRTFITGELDKIFDEYDEYVSILKGLHNTRSTNISLPKEKEKKGLG